MPNIPNLANPYLATSTMARPKDLDFSGPLGSPGAFDVYRMSQDRDMFNESKNLAMQAAGQQQQMNDMQAQEAVAGQPGRLDQIAFENAAAKEQLNNKDLIIGAEILKKKLSGIESEDKIKTILDKDMNDISMQFYNARNEDKTGKSADALIEWMKENKPDLKIQGKSFGEIPIDVLKGLLYANGSLLMMKQKSGTIAGEQIRTGSKEKIAAENNATRIKVAELVLQGKKEMAARANEVRMALANNKPMSLSQGMFAYIKDVYGNDSEGALEAMRVLQYGGAGVNNQVKLDIANKLGVNLPEQAEGPSLPKSQKTGPSPVDAKPTNKADALKDLKVGSPFNGKQVKGIGRNAKGEIEQILLEDGTVEIIK